MKKLNKKGFTLIELMVVIAILVVIMGIALPNITSSIERSKQKQKNSKIELITSAAELYFDRNSSTNKADGVLVSTIISDQDIPGVEVTDICDNTCCVKYISNKYQLVDNSTECNSAS